MTDPTTNPPLSDDKERVIVAVVNWRARDRHAIAHKGASPEQKTAAERAEYRARNALRDAADKLGGES